jgi:hypothetical protein
MKQQILDILDKSTSNGMKAKEIMELLNRRHDLIIAKWNDILSEDEMSGRDVIYKVANDMVCPEDDL